MAGEPEIAAGQAVDALRRQVAALTLESARLARENTRLSGELQQRTDDLRQSREDQAAIGEVLAAISRSTVDLAPLLQTLTDTALRLCEADMGFILRRDGEAFFVLTAAGATPEIAVDAEDYRRYQATRPIEINRGSVTGRVALAVQPVQIPDIAADPEYRLAGATQLGKIRTQVGVPLVREGALVGVLILARQRVEPFSERQVGLLSTFADQAVIAMENARLLGELRVSLDQQTATGDVLRAISRSSTDLGEVLDTLLGTVARLCKADQTYMFRRNGEQHHLVAAHGVTAEGEAFIRSHPFRPGRGTTSGRVAMERRVVHIDDVMADPDYDYAEGQRSAGFRTMLGLPLLREDDLLGVFVLSRTTVDPFSAREIELASGFADQAVIAIENARLFEELRDRQAELRVTLDNTGDAVVMFDADFRLASWNRNFQEMLDIPDAFVAGRPGYDDYLRLLVGRGELGEGDAESIVAGYRERATRQWSAERTRPDGRIIEVRNNPVPDGGAVLIYSDITERKRAEAEIAAARDAAEEALEQQTATAEILRAISQSPTDVQPVLDAVVKAAVRFCGATDAVIILREGEGAFFAAHEGPMTTVLGSRLPLDRETSPGRAILDGRTCHLPDIAALDPVEFAGAHRIAAAHGFRAALAAPLLRQGTAIGSVTLRKAEAGPFAPRQIELLETFAAQAVIAIENVRLFNDLSESLEQQTATSEILRVIASSPNDVQPVFDVVVKAAVRLCGAQDSLVVMRHGSEVVFEAHEGPLGGDRGDRWPLVGENVMGRAIIEGRTVHVADASALAPGELDRTKHGVALYGFKAIIAAPLMRKGSAIGALLLRRREAGAYTPRQIELLETFAAQAVIAIENVRLFNDLSESLEQQTATAEVLAAINASLGDLAPIFATILQKAHALGGVAYGSLQLYDGQKFRAVAVHGVPEPLAQHLRNGYVPGPDFRQLIEGAEVAHYPDMGLIDDPNARATVEAGIRTLLAVPLRKDGRLLGQIVCARMEVLPFSHKEIALLQSFATQAVIAMENARLLSELRESLEQQTATADILRVISQSPTDVAPVLSAVAKAALKFCGARDAQVVLRDGDSWSVVAHEGPVGALGGTRRLTRETAGGRAMMDGDVVQIADLQSAEGDDFQEARDLGARLGFRSALAAPLLRDGVAIGAISLRRPEAGAFTPNQVALLESFAAQAVIAIENVRLFTELRDALEQQTATADILSVISRSPTDVQPVLEAVTRAALRFCGAPDALVLMRDGDDNVVAAHEGTLTATLGLRRPITANFSGQALLEGRTLQIADVDDLDPDVYAGVRALAREHGWRASTAAPMMHAGKAIGLVVLRKPEPGLLSPRQIALLETFAAQAVIAIENVRLFTELREALEQQTATADILGAISRSPTDVQPVLDAVARAALRFCGAPDAVVWLRDGDDNVVAAHQGTLTASLGMRRPMATATFSGQAMLEGRTRQIADVDILDATVYGAVLDLAREHKWRASAAAPMMHGGKAIGCVVLRKPEPGLLSPRQIALLETFAAQAVIAIENVRLFTELSESLEQQTATAEILRVISQSPTDVNPVLTAVVKAALKFCGARDALVSLRDDDTWFIAAHEGPIEATRGPRPLTRGTAPGRAMIDGAVAHVADLQSPDADDYPEAREYGAREGFRAVLAAPLLRDNVPIGAISLRRPEPGAFTANQVDLLKSFAAQAVIAIENVRLFTELRDSLEQQTATAEILTVISQSPTDVGPVLSAVARAAMKFCGANDALVVLRDGNDRIIAAHEGPIATNIGERRRLTRLTAPGRAMTDREVVQIVDLQSAEGDAFPEGREVGARMGFRSALAAPLLRDEVSIGAISLRRREAGTFEPRQVDLLKTFAAQAVIAIENVRLFTELRETLDQQTASAEILRVISQSPTDVQPVLDAIAESAVRLCASEICAVYQFDGTLQHLAAHYRVAPEVLASLRQRYPREPDRDTVTGRAILERTIVHVSDIVDDPRFPASQNITAGGGYRAVLAVPMMQDEQPIGVIFVVRLEATPFSDKQIELLRTFAAQAVIAIQNVRLFTELRDSLERLKAAQANLVQSEKMASLGQLTAGIAHEIKNPLNFVNNFAALSVELLDELKQAAGGALATLDGTARAEVDETMELLVGNLGKIAEHGKRADGIVRSMLSHSRGGSGDWAPSDINALVEEALNLAYHGARAQDNEFNVTLERDFEKSSRPIDVVPQDVTRVFLNLFGNGFYAVGKRRRADKPAGFRPTLRVTTRDLGEAVEVRVRDNGTGIPPDVREKLFQPFFTTKPTGEGTGLGLSISYDIVTQQHGGTIEVESEPGSFTEFTVRLPRRRVQPSERA